jgi:6-phosphofructokinase
VREIVMNLYYQYGVKRIYGVPGGLCGFYDKEVYEELTPETVMNIHNEAGSFIE